MQKGEKIKGLKLLKPKNLAKEVDIYGYHFSWKAHVLLMVGALAGLGAVGLLFRLKPVLFIILVGGVFLVLPVLILDMYKKMYEQKRFADAAAYMEQMLYSFQKTGKVIGALKECREIFSGGQMRQTLDTAISHLEQGNADTGQSVLRESLEMLEKQYPCTKMRMVHQLLISAEEYGGDSENSILILLEDMEGWKKRGYRLQAEKKKSHTDNVISIVVAMGLCAVALYVLEQMKDMFSMEASVSVFQIPLIQMSSILFLLFLLQIFVKSSKNLTNDWLTEASENDTPYIRKSYKMITHYDEAGEKRKSLLLSLPMIGLTTLCFFCGWRMAGVLCLILTGVFLVQHKMGYRIAKRDVTNALYQVLPQWLMEMALLLQNNNVHVSLQKSLETSSGVLREELLRLLERLKKDPGKLSVYTSFCADFDLPEAASCMKMLHAVSETGTGNVKVQMSHLLERVHLMQNHADDIQNEKTAFHMKMIFAYPVGAATIKLLVDLTVGMAVMLQALGGIGGM